jgi:aspartate-semialdehyde dehydrogenase
VFVETESEVTPAQLLSKCSESKEFSVYSISDEYPLQIDAAGSDEIHLGRVRKDPSVPHGLSFWIVADNVRKGAALNAVQIVEHLLNRQ